MGVRVQSRRTDAFPSTWEVPVGLGIIWVMGALLALPVGQGVAFLLTGEGFVWPGPELLRSIVGLLAGAPGRGLPSEFVHSVPPALVIYAAVAFLEAALGACSFLGLTWWWRTVGPNAQFGMAPRHEVKAVLGRAQLRHRRKVIRPDLARRARR